MTEAIGTTCGNCGKPVGVGDVICPHCAVLLAAYQSPSGSAIGATTATTPVTETYAPPPPASTSIATPIPEAVVPIAPAPSPLRGPTSVAAAATTSEDIASQLSEMARDTSSFAETIDAELKDAKVVFDEKQTAQIATAPSVPNVSIAKPEIGQPAQNVAPARTANPDPNRKLNPPKPPRIERMTTIEETLDKPTAKKGSFNTAIIIFAVFAIVFVFRNPNAFFFLIVALVLGGFFFRTAIKASKSTSRRSSQMPVDKKK